MRNRDQVVELLEECIEAYREDEDLMWYRYWLDKHEFSSDALYNWIHRNKDEEIIYLQKILEDMQENRLWNELIKKKGRVNTTGAIFALKARHGAIEEEKRREQDNIKATEVNVSFNTVPKRSKDAIEGLLNG